jgi:PAS domain S-box-containing protein
VFPLNKASRITNNVKHFETLVNSIAAIVWEADFRTNKNLFVSNYVEKLLGYPVEQWYSQSDLWKEICHPDDLERISNAKGAVSEEHSEYELTYRLRKASGEWIWLFDRVKVDFEDGNATIIRGITYDISERKRLEEALTLVVEVVVEAGELSTLEEIVQHCLVRIAQLGGFAAAQVWLSAELERPLACSGEIFFAQDAEAFREVRQDSLASELVLGQGLPGQAALAGKAVFCEGFDCEPRQSLIRHEQYKTGFAFSVGRGHDALAVFEFFDGPRVSPDRYFINAIEEIAAYLAVVIERRQTQELLLRQIAQEELVLDSTPAFIFFKDRHNRIVKANRAGCMLMGLTVGDMVGRNCADVFPEQAEKFYLDDLKVMTSGKPLFGIIEKVSQPGCSQDLWLSTDKIPWKDELGKIQGVIGFSLDITSLKTVQDQLKASQQDLELKVEARTKELEEANVFFNLCQDLLCIADLEGHFRRVNLAWVKKTGYSQEELIARPYIDFVHPEDRERTLRVAQDLLVSRSLADFENRYICKDGSCLWLLWSAIANLETGCFFAIAYDITDRKQAEQELFDMSTALTNAVEGIARIGANGCYLSVNNSYAGLLACEPEELMGTAIVSSIYCEELDKWHQCLVGMRSDGKSESELVGVRKDGSLINVAVTLVRVNDADGHYKGYYIFSKDITKRKTVEASLQESQSRFRQLSAHVPGGLFQFLRKKNGAFSVLYVSPSCRSLLNVEPSDILRKPSQAFARAFSEDLPKLRKALEEAYDSVTLFTCEWRMHTASGDMKWLKASSSPEVLVNGDILFNGLLTDITEVRRSEEEIRKLNKDLNERVENLAMVNRELATLTHKLEAAYDTALEASKLKSEFVANISHEIRTPISAVIGMSELLLDSELNSEQRKLTSMMKDSGRSLLAIINDILDFSKVESGHIELDIVEFNLLDLMEDCALLLLPSACKKGLSFVVGFDPRLPVFYKGDPVRIRQVLLNLAGNAVKFTKQGEVSIRAELDHPIDDNSMNLKIIVEDTGVGMSEAARKRLFKPFVQADGSTTRKFGGTGLGLSISRRLLDIMGGSIDFTSASGKGSTFWFNLPLLLKPGSVQMIGDCLRLPAAKGRAMGEILVISPSANLRGILARYFDYLDQPYRLLSCVVEARKLFLSGQAQNIETCIYDFASGGPAPASKEHRVTDTGSFFPPNSADVENLLKFTALFVDRVPEMNLLILGLGNLTQDARLMSMVHATRLFKPFRLEELKEALASFLIPGPKGDAADFGEQGNCGCQSSQSSGMGFTLLESVSVSELTCLASSFAENCRGELFPDNGSITLDEPAVAPGDAQGGTEVGASASKPVVLVAEDNLVMQELAARQLEKLGVKVFLAGNGLEVLKAFNSGRYDLIFMDCQMPELDGYEATAKIREQESACGGHVPIVAMTASAMSGDRENCLAKGMDDYLSKPVGREQLSAVLSKWLPNYRFPKDEKTADSGGAKAAGESAQAFDLQALAKLYGGDVDGLLELLQSFRTEVTELKEGLEKALALKDYAEFLRLMHQLKGLAVVMTADKLAKSALNLEALARKGEYQALEIPFQEMGSILKDVFEYILWIESSSLA